ncbi:YIP1 family protein [Polycladomyces abyssicola]|uniref:YIP1 family protein n=1 Tax=Polycladomyces abyssicola TaxID=1125966 RepID=A0A8D5UDS0_9BACL|nr:YIP1 family protein [Polycladomyces abyssicola]BCU80833.1 YIP1 family protein [Polycladomyces abyssicola]
MENYQEINPWKHIWTRPRQTMAYLLQSDYSGWKWIIPLAWLAGVYDILFVFMDKSVGLFGALVYGIILGLIGGIVSLLVESLLVWLSGKMLGGTGEWRDVLSAVTWGKVPIVTALFVYWVPMLLMFGGRLFQKGDLFEGKPFVFVPIAILLFLLLLVIWVWYLYVISNTVAKVHQVSGWKGFGIFLLGKLFYLIAAGILGVLVMVVLISALI